MKLIKKEKLSLNLTFISLDECNKLTRPALSV
jgi:hypothetical protein